MTRDLWRDRRVFITGQTGFKGTWLTAWLTSCGARVTGYSLETPGDVRDTLDLRRAMVEAAPDAVFHLAAQSLVRASFDDRVATYATNLMGAVHVLDALRHVPSVRAAISVISDKWYAPSSHPHVEGDPFGGDRSMHGFSFRNDEEAVRFAVAYPRHSAAHSAHLDSIRPQIING